MSWIACGGLWALGLLAVAQDAAKTPPLRRDEQEVAKLIALGPDRYRAFDTDHFTIVTDAPYETIRPLTGRLEGIYGSIMRFCAAMQLTINPPPARLVILLFDRFDEFVAYAERAGVSPGTAAGFYDQSTNIAAFANILNGPTLAPHLREINSLDGRLQLDLKRSVGSPNPTFRREELADRIRVLRSQRDAFVERFNRLVLQHEAAHQVLFNIGVHVRGADNPAWLVEGLACQFEVPQSDLGGDLKRVNQLRLGDFREALRVTPNVRDESKVDFRAACDSGSITPLTELVTMNTLVGENSSVAAGRYAQAWALVFYLYRERRIAFSAYLAQVADRRAGATFDPAEELAEFLGVFGPLDGEFTRDLLHATLRLRFEPNEP